MKKVKVNRSAITGEFVTKKHADSNPKTTVTETIKKQASKPPKKR